MNILVANDDGIKAAGLLALVDALSEVATVYVCAPHQQRSAASHSISMREPIRIKSTEMEKAEIALLCTGTPADCVKLGLKVLSDLGIEIDMIFSGINMGANLGTDVLYSGTVAAAIEGSICGKPSVAVSVDSHEAIHFNYACQLAVNCVKNAYEKIPKGHVLNINVPNLPAYEIGGVKFTSLGPREYDPLFVLENGIEGDKEYIDLEYSYGSGRVEYDNLTTYVDVVAVQKKFASITPLKYDMTAGSDLVEDIRSWGLDE